MTKQCKYTSKKRHLKATIKPMRYPMMTFKGWVSWVKILDCPLVIWSNFWQKTRKFWVCFNLEEKKLWKTNLDNFHFLSKNWTPSQYTQGTCTLATLCLFLIARFSLCASTFFYCRRASFFLVNSRRHNFLPSFTFFYDPSSLWETLFSSC